MRSHLPLTLFLILPVFSACQPADTPPPAPRTLNFTVQATYPQDPQAFTQGLYFENSKLFMGTGLYGESSLRLVDLHSGTVLQKIDLADELFGEGITIFQNELFQLTWKSKRVFVYEPDSFKKIREHEIQTEGWGLTHDSEFLYLSDGTSTIYVLDSKNLKTTRKISVTRSGKPVDKLNELEFVHGFLLANVWKSQSILVIDPQTGHVTHELDLTSLLNSIPRSDPANAVLNGVAYDHDQEVLLVTGKLWPNLAALRVSLPRK